MIQIEAKPVPVFETFSKRLKIRERAGKPDIHQYEDLPQPFRIQVIHTWGGAIGPYFVVDSWHIPPPSNSHWKLIHDTLARERGVFYLADKSDNPFVACQKFLLTADTDGALDIIELSFGVIDLAVRRQGYDADESSQVKQGADDAIEELNYRFRDHRIGYQYTDGKLIRVDSQYVHSEVVKPALSLLSEEGFSGPSEEFLNAHEHYRHGRHEEAIAEALKSFESTMKAICEVRKWAYGPNATAKPLIGVLRENELIPRELESQFTALSSVLESGLPVVRNKMGGHGQGKTPRQVPAHLASYALHLAASNIVFLIEAHRAK